MLPMSNIYKLLMVRILLHLVQTHRDRVYGPCMHMLDCCFKYQLQNYVFDSIESGEYFSMSVWKKMVKLAILTKYKKQMLVTQPHFKSLRILHIDSYISINNVS